jgi:hypothetical protein
MEEKDPIEEQFRETFSDFEKEPPPRVWKNLHAELHPLPAPAGFRDQWLSFSLIAQKPLTFYLSISTAALALFFGFIYFGAAEKHTIRGHAYSGESRLQYGNAVLFRVNDLALPWDSLEHYRTDDIDHTGHFRFRRVPAGNYLIRVSPEKGSPESEKYHASWFDRHETADSANVIAMGERDASVEVNLRKK